MQEDPGKAVKTRLDRRFDRAERLGQRSKEKLSGISLCATVLRA
jgi:hypothetical protein